MVAWYDPLQLLRTGLSVADSTLFGRHADFRLIEALGSPTIAIEDYTEGGTRKEIWLDYVADVGDGWDSTYAVAYALAQAQLKVNAPNGDEHVTERGAILVFGGDEVYPVASRSAYEQRLVDPYSAALPKSDMPYPDAYAVAGNHDWYDSLVSFTRLFCSKDWFAGWRTKQTRSYFALKLPQRWWLIGTDMQLDSDIDDAQVSYFNKVAAQMGEGDRVILCNAEPHWIYAQIYGDGDPDYNENNLAFLEKMVFKKQKISVFIAGDLHHYRRHEDVEGTQKITAGGGGAFLHPTHGPNVDTLAGGFTHKASFPDTATSRNLCWRNFGFLFLNPYFGVLTGLLYVLTAWSGKIDPDQLPAHDWCSALSATANAALQSPATAFWSIAIFLGFLLFTDTHSKIYRSIAGPMHAIVHLLAAFVLGWGAASITVRSGLPFNSTPQLLWSGALIFAGGWIIGSCIMGTYLFVSLNCFGRHGNEAFSSLAIPDWKNFLRMKISANGELTIYPIGLRRVPRKWKAGTVGSTMVPDDTRATDPELIERPIVV
jgi:hypothetical protein